MSFGGRRSSSSTWTHAQSFDNAAAILRHRKELSCLHPTKNRSAISSAASSARATRRATSGRASCRKRGCTYGEISVYAVAFINTIKETKQGSAGIENVAKKR